MIQYLLCRNTCFSKFSQYFGNSCNKYYCFQKILNAAISHVNMVSATTRPRVSDVIVRVATPALTAVKVSISYHTRMVIALGYK